MQQTLMAESDHRDPAGASLRQAWVIWRNAMLAKNRLNLFAYTALFVVLALFLGLAPLPFKSDMDRALFSPPFALFFMALFHWDRFLIHTLAQNSPAVAGLVPRQHASVRLAVVLAWLLAVAPVAWLSLGFEHSLLIVLVYVNYITAAGLMRAGYGAGSVISMAMILSGMFVFRSNALQQALTQAPVIAALSVLTLGFAWLALRKAFPRGGERHWRILPGQHKPVSPLNMLLALLKGKRDRIYAWKLRYDLQRSPTPGHLMLHALGPNNHRFDLLGPLAGALVVAALLWWLASVHEAHDWFPKLIVGVVLGSIMAAYGFCVKRFVTSMERTGTEQALVRLTPGAPDAACMNRVLARQLLAISLSEWLAMAVFTMGMAATLAQAAEHLIFPASALIATFALNGLALRNYSDKGMDSYGRIIGQGLIVVASFALMMRTMESPLWWSVSAIGALLAGGFVVYDRWRQMLATPPAFPAGRSGS